MPERGALLSRLNASTGQHHADLDRPWLDLLRHDVAVADYCHVLVRTYGLLAPFESACNYTPGLGQLLDFRQLLRAGFIAQDLLSLGLSPGQVASIATTPSLTMFRSAAEAVGWLYVFERSSLLHHGARRHLARQLPSVERACTYLASANARTDEQWSALSDVLDTAGSDPASADEIERAAHTALRVARHWLDHTKAEPAASDSLPAGVA